jgi:hypothetical protein
MILLSTPPSLFSFSSVVAQETLLDALPEGDEDDEFSDDSEESEIPPDSEEEEIRAAFEAFADGLIHYPSLRGALIQLLNCNIPQSIVDQALIAEGFDFPDGQCALLLDEFRQLVRIAKEILEAMEADHDLDSDLDLLELDSRNDEDYESPKKRNGKQQDFNNGQLFSPLSIQSISVHNQKGNQRENKDKNFMESPSGFWRSPSGIEMSKSVPPSPPPLNHRAISYLSDDDSPQRNLLPSLETTIDKKSEMNNNGNFEHTNDGGGNSPISANGISSNHSDQYPVGSAVRFARNRQ